MLRTRERIESDVVYEITRASRKLQVYEGKRYRGAGGGRQPFRAGRAAPTPILIKRSHKRLTNWPYVMRFIGVPEWNVKMFQS